MKKRIVATVVATLMLVIIFPTSALADDPPFLGSGTQGDPYLIQSADDLAMLATLINEGDSPYSSAYFLQTTDIDLSAYTHWTPIGNDSSDTYIFEGSYDGGNYSISNLSIYATSDSVDSFGVFGYAQGEIKNLNIDGGRIRVYPSEGVYVGSIVGQFNGGSVQNCSSSATIEIVTTSRDYYAYAGGIIGGAYNNNVIENCSHSGSLSVVNNNAGGGYVGGVVGVFYAGTSTVRDCYNTGSIYGEGKEMSAAGIIGYAYGTEIERCFNTGDVTTHSTHYYYVSPTCGGIVVSSPYTNITDCFNLGTIIASADYEAIETGAAGIAASNDSTIENCYNAGMVYADYCGGIGGELHSDTTLIGCYYADTCELADHDGNFSANKCSLSQMKQEISFTEFDFVSVWEIVEGEYYPVLQDLPFTYTTGLSISQSTEELSVSETVQLTATVSPTEATTQSVVWTSDDDSVATVDKTGLVTGKKVGAATITVTTADGGFSETCDITVPGYSLDIYGNGSVIRFEDGEDAIINGSPSVTYTDILLICGSDVQLTLNNVNIDNSANADTPVVIFSGTGNQLILQEDSTLRGGENEPAVRVDQGAALEISGSGSLYTYGGANAAGIGSGTGNGGSITISDGQITSIGGENGAGIGSGTGNAGSITISDGQITSTGGNNGAGIGSGYHSDVTSIAISGGSVDAFGGYDSAGIGSGPGGTAESIAISGGTVNVLGNRHSAGIGSGSGGTSSSITISDGVITADGNSSGIGGGYCGYSGLITISGGVVNATVSDRDGVSGMGSGIGGGNECSVNTINITGGTIYAVGERSSAGIGGSFGTPINTINISGGRISAFGGDGYLTYNAGAGIGTGANWHLIDITISGGEIYACGGSDASSGYKVDIGLAGYPRGGVGFEIAPVEIVGDAAVFLEHDVCGVKDGPYTHTHMDVSDSDAATIFGVAMNDDWAPTGAWILATTLDYDANGGEQAPDSTIQHVNTEFVVGDSGEMTRVGYDFLNWNTQSNGSGDDYIAGDVFDLTEDLTLYAIWEVCRVDGVDLEIGSKTIGVGDTVTLNATVSPANALDKSVTWSTSNSSVATVSNGVVTAKKAGTATVTVRTVDGSYTDTCKVNVTQSVTGISLDKETVDLYIGQTNKLTATISPEDSFNQNVVWSSDNENVATVANGVVTAINTGTATITVTAEDGGFKDTCAISATSLSWPTVAYRSHVQNIGWQDWVYNRQASGTSGQSLRLEGMQIYIDGQSNAIEYRTHVQDYGWLDWVSDGAITGTSGESKRLEAIDIRLTGTMATQYDIYYRVHAQNFGWLDWAKNGASAGTAGYAYRLEAIQIQLVEKGSAAPGSTTTPFSQKTGPTEPSNDDSVLYHSHVQDIGWQSFVSDGEMSGTSGQSLRLEGMQIYIDGKSNAIEYRTHVQDYGWMGWVSDGEMTGTSGESKRLEAITIRLTGDMAAQYDIYYRVHAQNFGWLGWAKNGAASGTAGFGYRLEAIQIVLVEKGGAAPGSTDDSYYSAY